MQQQMTARGAGDCDQITATGVQGVKRYPSGMVEITMALVYSRCKKKSVGEDFPGRTKRMSNDYHGACCGGGGG